MVPNEVPWWGAISPPPVRGDAMSRPRKEFSLTNEDPCEVLDRCGTHSEYLRMVSSVGSVVR